MKIIKNNSFSSLLIIGVTGFMASGKSTFCNFLKNHFGNKVFVIELDRLAKKLFTKKDIQTLMETKLKVNLHNQDGSFSFLKMRTFALKNKQNFQQFDEFNKQPLRNEISNQIFESRTQHQILLLDAANLFNHNLDELVDKIIFITAPKTIRTERLNLVKKFTPKETKIIHFFQTNYEDVAAKIDLVIDSSGDILNFKKKLPIAIIKMWQKEKRSLKKK